MFVKTKQRAGHTNFFLCIAEHGGGNDERWKAVEYSVCLGETLELNSAGWVEILQKSPSFRSVPLEHVLEVVEQYAEKNGLRWEILAGLREAVRPHSQKSRRTAHSERRSQTDEYTRALRVLGLPPGASNEEVESAFRRAARRHHPDAGGDPAKFRAIVDARNLLLERNIMPA